MATLKDILDRQKEVTDKISTQVRTLSAALIVFTWGIFNATEGTFAIHVQKGLTPFLLLVDVFSVLALVADYVQYFCAQLVVNATLKDPENLRTGNYQFDDEWLSYRAQDWAFWSKQAFCAIAVFFTFLIIFLQMIA